MAPRHQTSRQRPVPRSMHPWRHRAGLAAVATLAFIAVTAACGTTSDNTATTSTAAGGSVTTTVAPGTSSSKSTTSTTGTTGSTSTTVTTPSTSSSTAPPDDDGGIDPMTGADTTDKSGPASGGIALLSAVRAARHEGYDRVVFEFSNRTNGRPGYSVRYVPKPIHADASGEEVPVAGSYVLQVRMEPASGVDLSSTDAADHPLVTYTGPKRFTPGTPEVAELVQSGDFEAVLNWSIGLRDKVDFRIYTLTNPTRLVVDVRNH